MTGAEWMTALSIAGVVVAITGCGHLVVALLVALTGLLVPMPRMALDVLIGLLQAYIFAVLTTVYVGAALRASES
jgi:F0F1-type ATP synthase membrane subunit a